MKQLTTLFLLASLLACRSVQAHAHLVTSNPADGSAVTSAPAALVLQFSESARVTAAAIQRNGDPKQVLHGLPTSPAATVSIPLSVLTAGAYTVTWRVVGADGHVMSGKLHFSVAPAAH